MKKEQSVSMREVSRLSGVSIATVSRVIHKSGRFSAATEQRVREVMERLNYVPDVVAQGMRMRSMPIVGIIVPDIMDENYALMVRTMQTELFQNGYSVAIFNTNEDSALAQHFVEMLKMQRARGIVYIPDRNGGSVDMEGIPTVYFDRRAKEPQLERSVTVECDNFGGAKRAVGKLIAQNKRRIALLSDEKNISSHRERIRGYHAALEEAGLQPGPVYLVDPQRTTEAIAALRGVFDHYIPFDSIFCTSIRLTIGALTVLHNAGISRQTAQVLGFGEHRLHRYGLLPYLAVKEPILEMSAVAARELLLMMAGEEPEKPLIVLPLADATGE